MSLSFSNFRSVGADKCGGIFNWIIGLTTNFNTNVNCSGEETLLSSTTAAATWDIWLCVSCRWPNKWVTACCPALSNVLTSSSSRILFMTSGPVGMLSLEVHCCILSTVSSGCSRNALQSLSGMVSSTTWLFMLVK